MEAQKEIGDYIRTEISIPGLAKDVFCKKAEKWAERTFKKAHIRAYQTLVTSKPDELVIKEAFINVTYGETPDMTLFTMKMSITNEKAIITFTDIIQYIEGIGFFKIYEKKRCQKLAEELQKLIDNLKKSIDPNPAPKPLTALQRAQAEIAASKVIETKETHTADETSEVEELEEVISA